MDCWRKSLPYGPQDLIFLCFFPPPASTTVTGKDIFLPVWHICNLLLIHKCQMALQKDNKCVCSLQQLSVWTLKMAMEELWVAGPYFWGGLLKTERFIEGGWVSLEMLCVGASQGCCWWLCMGRKAGGLPAWGCSRNMYLFCLDKGCFLMCWKIQTLW